ncbi:MAG: hypothetical protein R3304_00635 [Longimicrobiales bacterium]|nr:hypothetical protein [Longimicrobiales bacterium]
MSDSDQLKPYHAKDSAPGQEAADVVAEVLKHAEEREAAAKKKEVPKGPPKWMLPLTVNLGVLALFFLIAQPDFLVVNPVSDPRSDQEVVSSMRRAMYMDGIMRIRTFREQNGRLPDSLEELGTTLGEQGVSYSVQGVSAYTLVATVGDEVIVFDSITDDPQDFVGSFQLPG